MRRSSGHKKNSVWGDNSYNVKYLVTPLSVFKAYKLYDIIFQISKRHLLKHQYYTRKELGGRKKKIIIIKNQLFREQLKVFPSKQCILIWKVVKLSLKCHFNRQMIAPSKLIPKIYCFHTFFLNKGDNLLLPVWKMLLPIIFEYLLDTDSKNIWFYILLY